MAEILRDGHCVSDLWMRVDGDTLPTERGAWLYTPAQWQILGGEAAQQLGPVGLWLEVGQEPQDLLPYLAELSLIVVHFPSFTDGRGHSLGHWLRRRGKFTGELRAAGDVFRDSVYELSRCGFNAFSPRDGEVCDNLLKGIGIFSESYQASVDQPEPLFRRRWMADKQGKA